MGKWLTGAIGLGAIALGWYYWWQNGDEPGANAPGQSAVVEQPSGRIISDGQGTAQTGTSDGSVTIVDSQTPASASTQTSATQEAAQTPDTQQTATEGSATEADAGSTETQAASTTGDAETPEQGAGETTTELAALAPATEGTGGAQATGEVTQSAETTGAETTGAGSTGGETVPTPKPEPIGDPGAARFDVVRVDKDGQMVVAGTAQPGQSVEILLDGEVVGEATADANGGFVAVLFADLSGDAQQLQLRVPRPAGTEAEGAPDERSTQVAEAPAETDAEPASQSAQSPATAETEPSAATGAAGTQTAASASVAAPSDTAQAEASGTSSYTAQATTGEAETEAVATESASEAEATGGQQLAAATAQADEPGSTPDAETATPSSTATSDNSRGVDLTSQTSQTSQTGTEVTGQGEQAASAEPSTEAMTEATTEATAAVAGSEAETPTATTTESESAAGTGTQDVTGTEGAVASQTATVAAPQASTGTTQEAGAEAASEGSQDRGTTATGATATGTTQTAGGTSGAENTGAAAEAASSQGDASTQGQDSEAAPATETTTQLALADQTQAEPAAPRAEPLGEASEPRFALSAPVIILPSTGGDDAAPALVQPGAEGLTLLQPGGGRVEGVVLDRISYGESGEVRFTGRGRPGRFVRIYGNAQPLDMVQVGAEGAWRWSMPRGAAERIKLFRFDQLDPGGNVASRIETPFEYSSLSPQVLRERKVVIQKGDVLWRIAEQFYGEGLRYSMIYGANSALIRDPDLIYPGQVFTIPELVDAN